jgi:hypothetical protein
MDIFKSIKNFLRTVDQAISSGGSAKEMSTLLDAINSDKTLKIYLSLAALVQSRKSMLAALAGKEDLAIADMNTAIGLSETVLYDHTRYYEYIKRLEINKHQNPTDPLFNGLEAQVEPADPEVAKYETRHATNEELYFFPKELGKGLKLSELLPFSEVMFEERINQLQTLKGSRSFITVGSCFARHISSHLSQMDLDSISYPIDEGSHSALALASLLKVCEISCSYDEARYSTSSFSLENYLMKKIGHKELLQLRGEIQRRDAIIITLGAQSYLRCPKTNKAFLSHKDLAQLGFMQQPEIKPLLYIMNGLEVYSSLKEALAIIRKISATIKIVLTVSPIPMRASNSPQFSNIIEADIASKSAALSAAKRIVTEKEFGNILYYPSYEMVRELSPWFLEMPFMSEDPSGRHPSNVLVQQALHLFAKSIC